MLQSVKGVSPLAFRLIEMEHWKRKEYYAHYFSHVPCTYSMTVRLDITAIKKRKQRLYPTMLYSLATIVNRHEEFKFSLNEAGQLGVFDEMIPSYTVFHQQTETFSTLWTPYTPDYEAFCAAYESDVQRYGRRECLQAKPDEPPNTFPVTMIPWTSFDGFQLHLQKGYGYLSPIFTMGGYVQENDKTYLPLAVQVHHAVCDGFHVCRFLNELQALVNAIPAPLPAQP